MGFSQKFALNEDCILHDLVDPILARLVNQVFEHEAGKVSVKSFVPGNKFIAEGQTRHKSTFLQPEYSCERSREENALHRGKSNDTLGVGGVLSIDPFESPIGFLLDCWNSFYGIKQFFFLSIVSDVRINQQTVHFAVNIFNCYLESIEATSLGNLNFLHKSFNKIFINNAIRSSKEGQNMRDKSTSSAVQKLASAFLYICQMALYWIGRITNLRGFSFNNGSSSSSFFSGS